MPGISMMSKCGLRTENRFQKSETDVLVPKIWLLHAYYCWRDIWRSDQLNPHSCSKSPVPIFNDAMKRGLGESVFHYRFLAFAGDSTAYEKLRQPHNGSTELLKLIFIRSFYFHIMNKAKKNWFQDREQSMQKVDFLGTTLNKANDKNEISK